MDIPVELHEYKLSNSCSFGDCVLAAFGNRSFTSILNPGPLGYGVSAVCVQQLERDKTLIYIGSALTIFSKYNLLESTQVSLKVQIKLLLT